MATLLIRDLDDTLYAGLEQQARLNGRTIEDETREILRGRIVQPSPAPQENIMQIAARFFGSGTGLDLDLPRRSEDRDRPLPDFLRSDQHH